MKLRGGWFLWEWKWKGLQSAQPRSHLPHTPVRTPCVVLSLLSESSVPMEMEPVEDPWVFPAEDQEAGLGESNSILGVSEHLV